MRPLFFGVTVQASLAAETQTNRQPMTNIAKHKGDQLHTTLYPNGGRETILLLHGGPGFPDDLAAVVALLKEGFQVITFHQRGTGKSPCTSKDYSMKAYLSDIEAIREFYRLDKFHLWGHSWGGLYAQVYADQYAANLLSLFLCCPGSGTNTEWKQTEKEVLQLNKSKCTFWQWTKMGVNSLLGILGSDEAYRRLFKQVMKNYHDGFIATEDGTVDFSNLRAEPINKTRPEIVNYPRLAPRHNPPYPVTILYGDQDIYQSSRYFVLNRYPAARVLTVKNCGHIPWLHNPAEYKTMLKSHYEEQPARATTASR